MKNLAALAMDYNWNRTRQLRVGRLSGEKILAQCMHSLARTTDPVVPGVTPLRVRRYRNRSHMNHRSAGAARILGHSRTCIRICRNSLLATIYAATYPNDMIDGIAASPYYWDRDILCIDRAPRQPDTAWYGDREDTPPP